MSTPASGLASGAPDPHLLRIRDLIYQAAGIFQPDNKLRLLEDRCRRRMVVLKVNSVREYLDRLSHPISGREEMVKLLNEVTIGETCFFRNQPQLDALKSIIWPRIIEARASIPIKKLRIWSAGCSTGQEPYTLAMLVADGLAYYYLRNPLPLETATPKPLIPPPWKVEILASDISYSVLRAGQEGIYNENQMASVDYSYRLRYFDKVGERYAVKQALKQVVHFDFHNLKTEYLPQRNDAIFCRNVMMYFDEAEQKRLIEKFARCLNRDGYLFVGHAESLLGLTKSFAMVHRNSGTAYQKVEVNT